MPPASLYCFPLSSTGLSVGNQFSHWPRPQREWSWAVPVLGAGCRLPTPPSPASIHLIHVPMASTGSELSVGWMGSEEMKGGRNEWKAWMVGRERGEYRVPGVQTPQPEGLGLPPPATAPWTSQPLCASNSSSESGDNGSSCALQECGED